MKSVAIALFLLVLVAGTTSAEVHTWSNPDVEMWETYPVEFAGALEGIVSVEVRMAGNTGASRGMCETPGGSDVYEQPWAIFIELEDAAVAHVTSSSGEAYRDFDVTVPFQLTEDRSDWSFLADGITSAFFNGHGVDLPMAWPFCMPLASPKPGIDVFEIIVTTGAVATENTRWSAVKALYR